MVADAILVNAPSRRILVDVNLVDGGTNYIGIDAFLMVADAILVDAPSRRTPIGVNSVDGGVN